jgi:hypothetical protein
MTAPYSRFGAPRIGGVHNSASREWWRRASAAFVAAVAQDSEIQAREQLRREMRAAGYDADQCIRDLSTGRRCRS